jgi:hypothetical protein
MIAYSFACDFYIMKKAATVYLYAKNLTQSANEQRIKAFSLTFGILPIRLFYLIQMRSIYSSAYSAPLPARMNSFGLACKNLTALQSLQTFQDYEKKSLTIF